MLLGTNSGEISEGGGFGFERGDGFDEACDGKGVADAAGAADQTEHAAFAGELNGDANKGGNAGAVNLRDAVEKHDDFARASLNHRIERVVELFARLADGEAAVNLEDGHPGGLANVDLHWWSFRHG
jgi:hypothetical protein